MLDFIISSGEEDLHDLPLLSMSTSQRAKTKDILQYNNSTHFECKSYTRRWDDKGLLGININTTAHS